MRTRVRNTARALLVTASITAVGVGTFYPIGAYADTTSGDLSVLGGNQVNVPISVPVNTCGNAVAVLGTADAGCEGGAKVKGDGSGGNLTSGDHSVLGGNQVDAPVSLPTDICGNAVGNASAYCEGGAHSGGSPSGAYTSGSHSIGGGNQVNLPIKAPVNVCGNAAAVLGDGSAGCAGGSSTGGHSGHDGYGGGYRTLTAASRPIRPGLPVDAPAGLPVDSSSLPGSLPVDPSAFVGSVPVSAPAGLPVPSGARMASASPLGGLPVQPPVSLPVDPSAVVGPLPATAPAGLPGSVPVDPSAFVGSVPVSAPAGLPGGRLPGAPKLSSPLPVALPGGLPGAPQLPAAPQVPGDLPVAPQLPGGELPQLPDGTMHTLAAVSNAAESHGATLPARDMPGVPVASDISAPQLGAVTDQAGAELEEGTTGLAPMSKSQLLTSGVNPGSAYVLLVSALLATAAAAMAFTRRVRFGLR